MTRSPGACPVSPVIRPLLHGNEVTAFFATRRRRARSVPKGVATLEEGGKLKLVSKGGTERLLGVQMVSDRAADLIQLAGLGIRERTTADARVGTVDPPSHGERLIRLRRTTTTTSARCSDD